MLAQLKLAVWCVLALLAAATCEECGRAIDQAVSDLATEVARITPPAGQPQQPYVDVVREVEGQRPIFGFFASPFGGGGGTAWYVRQDHLVTAAHVVIDNDPLLLERFGGQDLFRVDAVHIDLGLDIALLRPADGASTELSAPVLSFSTRSLAPGENVTGICASPAEDARTVSMVVTETGVLFQYGPSDAGQQPYQIAEGIRLSGEAHQGCSGGPILDSTGQVVGMMLAAGNGVTLASNSEAIRRWVDANVGR